MKISLATYQNRCPQRLMTASLAISKQILHSNVESFLSSSPDGGGGVVSEGVGPDCDCVLDACVGGAAVLVSVVWYSAK